MRDQYAVTDLRVKVVGLMFWHEAHTKHMLTGSTNMHGQEVIHCLRIESFSIEVGKSGGDLLETQSVFFFHGGLFTQNNRAGLDVTVDLEMSSETTECEFDLVL